MLTKSLLIVFYINFTIWGVKLILTYIGGDLFDGVPPCALALVCRIGYFDALNIYMYILILGFLIKRFMSFISG